MARGRGNNSKQPGIGRLKIDALPVFEPCRITSQALRAFHRCKHLLRAAQYGSPGAIQIVGMVIVAQQHEIELTESFWTDSRTRQFSKSHRSRSIFLSGAVKCGVGH